MGKKRKTKTAKLRGKRTAKKSKLKRRIGVSHLNLSPVVGLK